MKMMMHLVFINSNMYFCPSHQLCLHSREKDHLRDRLLSIFFYLKQFVLYTKPSHHIIFTGFHVNLFHTAISFIVSDHGGLCRSVRFTLHSSLLRILLLSKCFRLLCARSTSECFDSCWPSPETSMRIEHGQWGLMKQRRRC